MSTELALFPGQAGLPAHIADAFSDDDTNLIVREAVPALTFRGGKWRLKKDGEETVITKPDEDGDAIPVSTVQMIVVGVNQARSRIYFEGDFVEGESQGPTCWSSNGVAPDSDVESPCAKTCASCPWSVKGSKITQNDKEVTACATLKRLAVVPAGRISMGAMLLKLPQTSVWDKDAKEHEAKGFFAWDQYVAFLKARGVKHTASVVTKIKFDPNTAYPKLLFSAAKFVDADKMEDVKALVNSTGVKDMVNGNAVIPTPASGGDEQVLRPASKVDTAAAPKIEKTSEVIDTPPKRTRAPRKAKVEQVELPLEDDEEDDGFGDEAPTKKAVVKQEVPKAKKEAPAGDASDLAALADQWADFDDE